MAETERFQEVAAGEEGPFQVAGNEIEDDGEDTFVVAGRRDSAESSSSSDLGVMSVPSSCGASLPPSRGGKRKGSWQEESSVHARADSFELNLSHTAQSVSPAWSDVASVEEVLSDTEHQTDWAQMLTSVSELKRVLDEQHANSRSSSSSSSRHPTSPTSFSDVDEEDGEEADKDPWSPLVSPPFLFLVSVSVFLTPPE